MGGGASSKPRHPSRNSNVTSPMASSMTSPAPMTSPAVNAYVPNGSFYNNGTVVYGPGNLATGGTQGMPILYGVPQGYGYWAPANYIQQPMMQVVHAPDPKPPSTRKDEVFVAGKYKDIDGFVLNAPSGLLLGSFDELVWYLTRSNEKWDDICKIRAIFIWVTSIDVHNLQVQGIPHPMSPLEFFNKIRNNLDSHANLIYNICLMAGIPCTVVKGMNKSTAYEIGGKVDRKRMGSQWNAVYVNGEWRLLDAMWASSCVVGKRSGEWTLVDVDGNATKVDEERSEGTVQHRINEFYFLPDPDKLIWTHYPDDKQWQLLEEPVTVKQFEEHVYIRERFHYLGMKLLPDSQDNCVFSSTEGETDIVFSLPAKRSDKYRFKYKLYRAKKTEEDEEKEEVKLDRFVMFEHTSDRLRYSIRFPIEGKFKMDIFGLDDSDLELFDLACTYIITCDKPKTSCLPLPDVPAIGWGPGASAKEAGLKPITHDGATITTKDGNIEIRFAAGRDIQLHQMLKHALIDEATLSNYAVTRLENGEVVVNIRLPQNGEYALKLYADDAGNEGLAPNVLNYLIKTEGKQLSNEPLPNLCDGLLGKKTTADTLGIEAITNKGGRITAENGRAIVEFQAGSEIRMMAELHSRDETAVRRLAITQREENGRWTFDLDMPHAGEYSLNLFACHKDNPDRIHNVHSYLIKSEGRKLDQEEEETKEEEGKAVGEIPVETVQTSDNEVVLPVPPGYENVCTALHRRNANDPPEAYQVETLELDGIQMIRARLPEFGEYQMNLYDRDQNGVVRNIAKYQINRRPPGELYDDNTKVLMQNLGAEQPVVEEEEHVDDEQQNLDETQSDEDEQRRAVRRQLQKAIEMKDPEKLAKIIQAYELLNPGEEDEMLTKARKTLQAFIAKEELVKACQKRDLDLLKKAIARAKEANYEHRLDLQLAMANSLKAQLERIEKLRHAVLALDTKTVAEIKTYSNPPDGVHQSLMATFILLGNSPKDLRNWRTCQAYVGKTGRESLMRRISSFDPKDCSVSSAQTAKHLLENYTMSQIRDVSAGAATFFGWCSGMIQEIESSGGSGASEPRRSATKHGRRKIKSRNR